MKINTSHPKYTKLWDCIHHYIGCKCITTWYWDEPNEKIIKSRIEGIHYYADGIPVILFDNMDDLWEIDDLHGLKLILRHIDSMKMYEIREYNRLQLKRGITYFDTPESIMWLLNKGFDLFYLIENGLAVTNPEYIPTEVSINISKNITLIRQVQNQNR